jgi:hypothetical protein
MVIAEGDHPEHIAVISLMAVALPDTGAPGR